MCVWFCVGPRYFLLGTPTYEEIDAQIQFKLFHGDSKNHQTNN